MELTIELARLLVQTVDDSRRYLAKCREMGEHIPDDFVEGKVLYVLTTGQPYWTER